MSARSKVVNSIVDLFKQIDGISPYNVSLNNNVENKQIFWDEVNVFPYVCVNAGVETREYQASMFKWGHLNISIKIYVKSSTPQEDLELIIEDIEYILEQNNTLKYDDITNKTAEDIRLLQISTDEGLLDPIGVGEVIITVRYEI